MTVTRVAQEGAGPPCKCTTDRPCLFHFNSMPLAEQYKVLVRLDVVLHDPTRRRTTNGDHG